MILITVRCFVSALRKLNVGFFLALQLVVISQRWPLAPLPWHACRWDGLGLLAGLLSLGPTLPTW